MCFIDIDNDLARKFLNHHPASLITSNYKEKNNIMTVAWWSLIQDYPLKISISLHHKSLTYEMAKQQNYLCMNILTSEFSDLYLKAGEISGKNSDKFEDLSIKYKMINTLPVIDAAKVIVILKKFNLVEMERFSLFMYEVEKVKVKENILIKKDVNWDNYKTINFIDDVNYKIL
jgi:flavin reductase (DIM6/NTAB) family NADH-FMN oxidoreductase RutF